MTVINKWMEEYKKINLIKKFDLKIYYISKYKYKCLKNL